jgi:hypothetical protein
VAEENLATAYQLFGNGKDFQMAAGVQSDMARWWSVQGMIHTAKREFAQAIDAWQQAVDICRQINGLDHCRDVYTRIAIARMLRGLADALLLAGHSDEGKAASAEAHEILAMLGLPID